MLPLFSATELYSKEHFLQKDCDTVKDSRSGKTEVYMKVIGIMIKHLDGVGW